MKKEEDVQKLLPYLDINQCTQYMVNNKLVTPDKFCVGNCLKIFTTLCGYQTIIYEAKNLNFLEIQNPLPLIVVDDGTILVIYEKNFRYKH